MKLTFTRRRQRRARRVFNRLRREYNRSARLNAHPYSHDPQTISRLFGKR
jgi:hypothetical protein